MTEVSEQKVREYLEALRSTAAVPGGGSAAALAGAMGAALLSMVAKLSARKAKEERDRSALNDLVPRLDQISNRLLELSQHDIEAYRGVIDARKAGASPEDMARAYERAAEVPLASAEVAAEGLELAVEVSKRAWEMTSSDLAVGNDLLQSGLSGALGNVEVNLPDLKGDTAARIERRYQELRSRSAR